DDAGVHQPVGGHRGRVLIPGGPARADGHVHHVHLVLVGQLHGGQHDVGGGRPGAAEDPVGADGGVGGHAHHTAVRLVAVAGGDTGHVRAVALAVVRVRVLHRLLGLWGGSVVGVSDQVEAELDLIGPPVVALAVAGLPVTTEVGVVHVDTGVDDGDAHALAGVAHLVGLVDAGHPLGVLHLRGGVHPVSRG